MQTDLKKIRLFDLARAFAILAANPEKTFDLAVEVSDDQLTVLESNLHGIADKLRGHPMAHDIENLLSLPAVVAPSIIHERDVRAEERDPDAFDWQPIRNPASNVALGDKFTAWACEWKGVKLKITKHGPGKYEGFVDGQSSGTSKFRKTLRERLEKEATKRADA